MDGKSDDEGAPPPVIIEEAGAVAASQPQTAPKTPNLKALLDGDWENGSEDEKYDDEDGWNDGEDMYEQEI